jgi:thiol-disulfide isomerase/thioredoxin
MPKLRTIPALLVLAAVRAAAQQPTAPPVGPAAAVDAKPAVAREKPADIYDEGADAKAQIAAALGRAKQENRRVLVQWGANWCGWCHQLHELCAANAEIKSKLLYEYDVVLADIGKWDKNMDLAASYGAELKANGVPYLTVLAADGSVVTNHDSGSLERGPGQPGHDPAKVLAFLTENQAGYLAAADLRRDALAAASKDGRRVFLHFGAPWCGWCHKLEDWMARPEIAALLAKDFVDCKIDVDRTVGGKELLQATRGHESGGVPWFVFLDKEGKVLASSDGKQGNIGFPAAPEEIAHFGDMLRQAAVHLGTEEIATLVASLQPPSKP